MRQTLTAIHDQQSAWNGLGSALLSLYQQFDIATSVMGVVSITFYLACLSVLHITTPAMLSLEPFNQTIQTNVSTTLGLPAPDMYVISPYHAINSWIIAYHSLNDYISLGSQILPFMGRFSQISTIGLHGNTIYDILDNNHGIGNVTVNSTTFDVSCGILPNLHVTHVKDYSLWNITWELESDHLSFRASISGMFSTFLIIIDTWINWYVSTKQVH